MEISKTLVRCPPQAADLRKHEWGRSDLNRRPTDYEVIVWIVGSGVQLWEALVLLKKCS